MADIVLTTLNARYHHAAFGLRYLLANLGDLRPRAAMLEFGIQESSSEILAAIVAERPRIVGIGVYIWNVAPVTRLVRELKRLRPEIVVVLGGPEVSYETDDLPVVSAADYVIQGEADLEFAALCRRLLTGNAPAEKFMAAPVPSLSDVVLPYDLYDAEDIAQRVIYVEASRGCPFTCEFCLSALEIPVRTFDLDRFLGAMDSLLNRGARWFKFVDRTFNLNLRVSRRILEFFLERNVPGLHLHFEMIPDRLPEELKSLILRFPPGALQFEIGIQTFNDDIAELISRRQDNRLVAENFAFLTRETGVHLHADLIFGLPGESLESFAAGFDRLVGLSPQEIQVGMLKRLRGTPIVRHDATWGMRYSPEPPYEILETSLLPFETVQRMRRFSQLWDRVANRGHLTETLPRLWRGQSPFAAFLEFSDWLFERFGKSHSVARNRLAEELFRYLTEVRGNSESEIAESVWRDFQRSGRTDKPAFLSRFTLSLNPELQRDRHAVTKLPARQSRHLTTQE